MNNYYSQAIMRCLIFAVFVTLPIRLLSSDIDHAKVIDFGQCVASFGKSYSKLVTLTNNHGTDIYLGSIGSRLLFKYDRSSELASKGTNFYTFLSISSSSCYTLSPGESISFVAYFSCSYADSLTEASTLHVTSLFTYRTSCDGSEISDSIDIYAKVTRLECLASSPFLLSQYSYCADSQDDKQQLCSIRISNSTFKNAILDSILIDSTQGDLTYYGIMYANSLPPDSIADKPYILTPHSNINVVFSYRPFYHGDSYCRTRLFLHYAGSSDQVVLVDSITIYRKAFPEARLLSPTNGYIVKKLGDSIGVDDHGGFEFLACSLSDVDLLSLRIDGPWIKDELQIVLPGNSTIPMKVRSGYKYLAAITWHAMTKGSQRGRIVALFKAASGNMLERCVLITTKVIDSISTVYIGETQQTIHVYPSTANEVLHINFAVLDNYQIDIVNSLGQRCFNYTSGNVSSLLIDLSKYSSGLYYLSARSSQNDSYTQCFYVVH